MKQTLEERVKFLEKRIPILEEKILVIHHRSITNQGALPAKAEKDNPYAREPSEKEYVKD